MTRRVTILAVALLFVFGGAFVAFQVQTDGGDVEVKDVRFAGPNGQMMSATLYVPDGVSDENPAPGVVATHGYINSKETQSPFAIEFARRGMVVLAPDQTGHGYSDPPAFGAAFGGPPALGYMQSLSFVDNDNIGLEGHSMGGWASVAAAGTFPEGYKSLALVGSSTSTTGGVFGLPGGNPQFPTNTAVIFSEFDEFSMLMWGVPHASDVEQSERLQTLFGADGPVQEGQTYGSIEAGNARRLYTPTTTHPGDHLSQSAVGDAVEWMQLTLDGTDDMASGNQIWWLKELATLLSMVGGLLFLFPFGAALLERDWAEGLTRDRPDAVGLEGIGWYVTVAIAAIVPVVTYFILNNVGQGLIEPFWLFPQQITNGIMVWAVGNGLIIAVLFGAWHLLRNRDADAEQYGFDVGEGWRSVWRAASVAAAIVGGFYLLLAAVGYFFGTDFRFWVFAIKFPADWHLGVALGYVVPITAFFLALEVLLHGQLQRDGRSFREAFVHNWVAVVGGFVLLLLVQYGVLLSGSPMPFRHSLLTILAFQFVAVLSIAVAVSTYFYRKTGRVWTGAFVNGLLVTLILVAGTATHAPI